MPIRPSSASVARGFNIHLERECTGKDNTEEDIILSKQGAIIGAVLAIDSGMSGSSFAIRLWNGWGDLLVDRSSGGSLSLHTLAGCKMKGRNRGSFKYHREMFSGERKVVDLEKNC